MCCQFSEHWCCDVTVEPIRKTVTTVAVEPQNVTRVVNTTYQRDCRFGETPTSADGWLCEDVVSHVLYVSLIFKNISLETSTTYIPFS